MGIKGKFGKGAGWKLGLTPYKEHILVSYCGKMKQPVTVSNIKAFAWVISKKSSGKSSLN